VYALIFRKSTIELQLARQYILSIISRQTIMKSEGTNYCWVVQGTSSVTFAAVTSFSGRRLVGWTE